LGFANVRALWGRGNGKLLITGGFAISPALGRAILSWGNYGG